MIATSDDDPRVNIVIEQIGHLFELLDHFLHSGRIQDTTYRDLWQQGLKIKTAIDAFRVPRELTPEPPHAG